MAGKNKRHQRPPHIDKTIDASEAHWPAAQTDGHGKPNVVLIVLDDVGFGQLGCYGSSIRTPNIDRLADGGLRYTCFHTTALCSPTRASLLTGRNHHSNGLASIPQLALAYPAHNAYMPRENGTLAEVLGSNGYSTLAVGKWHLAPDTETHPAGPFDRWPLGRGFERFYGFLMGMIDHWNPGALTRDNHFVDVPGGNGYHLSEDLTDHAIGFVRDAHAVDPDKPFFLYLAYGAGHSPHHVAPEYADSYKGQFDRGWDAERETILTRQKELGIMPEHVVLPPRPDEVPCWEDLDEDRKRVYARFQEVFAGFMTHTDEQIGRVVDALDAIGRLDDTLIVLMSDNGASLEGGPEGRLNEYAFYNGVEHDFADLLKNIDRIGGPGFINNYPMGWSMAGNTPFREWKRSTYQGGIADPLIMHWPDVLTDAGSIRNQYHHVVDLLPTIIEAVGAEIPETIRGAHQTPIHGVSMWYTTGNEAAPGEKIVQYYEMLGSRALYYRGWKAVSKHRPLSGAGNFDRDEWELFYLPDDPNEVNDLAAVHPEIVRDLVDRWWVEAGRYGVLPLDDRGFERWRDPRPTTRLQTETYAFHQNGQPIFERAAPDCKNRDFTISARVTPAADLATEGVILSHGNRYGGYVLYVSGGALHFVYNYCGEAEYHAEAACDFDAVVDVAAEFRKTGEHRGVLTLRIGGVETGTTEIPRTIPRLLPIHGNLSCGADRGGMSVSQRYTAPFPFTGTLDDVEVRLGPQGAIEHDKVFEAMVSEQ